MKRIILILVLLFTSLEFISYAQKETSKIKKVVMIIAQNGFRDEELLEPKRILEVNGIEVKVASHSLNEAIGMLGTKVKPDMLVSDIDLEYFDAVIFIGGIGATEYWDDPQAHSLIRRAYEDGRLVAAICIAPVTLARAGILSGRRATVWSSEAPQLRSRGAEYTARHVEKDGNIITASGPTAAKEFAEELVKALLK